MSNNISNMPDEVLCHILGFLNSKQAVSTSVLSKKWEQLWKKVPTLIFDDSAAYKPRHFIRLNHIIDHVINCHDPKVPVKTFCLRITQCGLKNQSSKVNEWVTRIASWGGLEYLYLMVDAVVKIPSTILSCETLVELKMYHITMDPFPKKVSLPSLSKLVLGRTDSLRCEYVMKILHGCPILKDLEIESLSEAWGSFAEGGFTTCLPSELKICTLTAFKGGAAEIQFARNILKHSRSLCTMKICLIRTLSDLQKISISMSLGPCGRASPKCELFFN